MSAYGFFAACLRFVARRTDASTPELAALMADLEAMAAGVEAEGALVVPKDRLGEAARALAGVAGMLQQRILPEAVASGDAGAERRVRWMIDAAMTGMVELSAHAGTADPGDYHKPLPPPP